jgi:riboflavin kinase
MTQNRPSIDSVAEITEPFPVYLKGKVVKGFGRGSKELNIPTGIYSLVSMSFTVC